MIKQPIDPNHYFNRGNARKAKKEFDLAITDYNKALSIDANIVEVYNNRGNARTSKGDLTGALSDFNKALSLDPDFVAAYNNRGMFASSCVTSMEHSLITKRLFPLTRAMPTTTTIAAVREE